jgi:hypothetical protein
MHSILKNDTSKIYKEYHPHFGDLLLNFIFISGVTQNFMGSSPFDP